MLKNFKVLWPWLLSATLITLGIFVLIKPMRASEGMWRVFDDVHTVRTQEMVYELQQGQFPVRLFTRLGNGGGYLLFNFYSPLTYYLSAVLVLAGTSALNATKLLFQLAYVVGAIGMFGFLKVKFPKSWFGPLVGSLLLIASPYFNYDAYTRGALGELLGFAVIPWVFLTYELLKTTKQWFWSLGLAIAVSGQLYLHAISAFITLPFLALYFGFDWWQSRIKVTQWKQLVVAGLIAFGLSASYFLPMWFEKTGVQYAQAEFVASGYKSGFLKLTELLGISRAADLSIKPITLGLSLVIIGGLSLLSLWVTKTKISGFFTLALAVVFLILTPASQLFWEHSSVIQMAQFPYRYLMMATFLLVWLIVTAIEKLPHLVFKLALGGMIIFSSFWLNHEFAQPSGYYFAGEFKAEDPCETTTWQAEYLPKVTTLCLTRNNPGKVATSSGTLVVLETKPDQEMGFTITTNGEPGTLILGKYAYPGWSLTSNLGEKKLQPFGLEGILSADISAQETQFSLRYQNTLIRTLGNSLTAVTSIITLLGLLWWLPWKSVKTLFQP